MLMIIGMILIPKSYERVLLDTARDISIICFIFILILFYEFDKSTLGFQFSQEINIITSYNIFFSVGIDGISLCFMLLTAFIMPLCIIAAESIKKFSKEFLIYLLLIEFLLLISFSTTDLFFFYVFFESVLIPMFIIIGI